jgi:transcription factor IIIB subunit 2
VCFSCGTLISDSVIVNDVTFGEAPSGAALVQGTTVHAGQRYARTTNTSFHRGTDADTTRENSMRAGKEELNRLANSMYISSAAAEAFRLYEVAKIHMPKRPMLECAAICLYIECRKTTGNNTLLIDFAEKLKKNVFDLGHQYKKLVRSLGMDTEMEKIPLIEIEPILLKFANRLEFGDATRQVANDAASILSRMNRDWMVTGRQPQALCGAALLMAARMNNFRRSAREIVYITKAGDSTVLKRLEEFKRTKAGKLSVSDFRIYYKRLKDVIDPPSVYQAKEREEKKRKRAESTSTSLSRESSADASEATPEEPPRRKRRRVDGDGFTIPDIPVDPALGSTRQSTRKRKAQATAPVTSSPSVEPGEEEEEVMPEERPTKRRRQKKTKPAPIVIAEEDLIAEDELEAEIIEVVERNLNNEQLFEGTLARATAIAATERTRLGLREPLILGENEEPIGDEYDDDPEVANCLLSAEEIEVKEKIWVTQNFDWLQEQQARILDKAMDDARGKKKRQNKKRRSGVAAANETPASSPAEASQRMVERRAGKAAFSKHINYDRLQVIYSQDGDRGSRGGSEGSASGSPAPSTGTAATLPATPRFQIARTRSEKKDVPETIEIESDKSSDVEDEDEDEEDIDALEEDPLSEDDLIYEEMGLGDFED